MLKKKSSFDIMYGVGLYAYLSFGLFLQSMPKLIELGFPGHPLIVEKRLHLISATCYAFPSLIKNDIEYIHSKIILKNEGHKFEKEYKTSEEMRFKIIVQEGKVFVKCIDPFEDVF